MITSTSPRRLAAAVLACVAYYVIAVLVLALLNPEMSPLAMPISEYQQGRHPVLAGTTFFVLAAAIAALTLALRAVLRRSWLSGVGLTMFWIAAAGRVIAGVFPDMPMHAVGALMSFPWLCLGAVFLSLAPGRAPEWGGLRLTLLILALTLCAMLLAWLTVLSARGLSGLGQRLYFAVLFGWMTIVALRITTLYRSTLASEARGRSLDGPARAERFEK
jgi:hypothetical protein